MSDSFRRTIAFASNGLSQEKILQHKFPFPSYKRAAADWQVIFRLAVSGPASTLTT